MRFDRFTPCGECPFRNDVRPYLRLARATEIAESVVRYDQTFACHKTTGVEGGRWTRHKDRSMCAGAMILVKKSGWRNAMLQIAERLGLLDPKKLNMKAPVYESAAAMIAAHAED